MRWFYHNGSDQIGPYQDDDMITLVQEGSIRPDTMVWQEGTPAWVQARTTRLGAYLTVPASPPMMPPSLTPPPMNPALATPPFGRPAQPLPPHSPGQPVPDDYIRAPTPPKSLYHCWWVLLSPSIPYFVFGQTGKGFMFLALHLTHMLVSFLVSTDSPDGSVPAWFFVEGWAVFIASIAGLVDSYKVGKALRSRLVKKWEWYPA